MPLFPIPPKRTWLELPDGEPKIANLQDSVDTQRNEYAAFNIGGGVYSSLKFGSCGIYILMSM